MKRLLHLLLALTLIAVAATPASARKYGQTLRILAIGNSFSDDGMEHLPALLADMGVENVELARLYVGGCSLEQHTNFYTKGEAAYDFYHSAAGENRWIKSEKKVTMQYALEMGDWDIITLQQVSGKSGLYDSYLPYLDRLIEIVSKAQPKAELVWHMTWAYSKDSNHGDFPNYGRDQQAMYDAIIECVHQLRRDNKEIRRIIPSGTTVQSLRLSPINNEKDLTRDGYHIDLGGGRYALACTWYEELIRPYTRRSMMGNTLRLDMGEIKVDGQSALYIQRAARWAVKHPFKVKAIK